MDGIGEPAREPRHRHDGGRVGPLRCRLPAVHERFPTMRRVLASWATDVGMPADRVAAVVLASQEALANSARHAYRHTGGVLDLRAAYLPESGRVDVTVTDYGHWAAGTGAHATSGGCGLLLIDGLAEHTEVATGANGTSVRMSWHRE